MMETGRLYRLPSGASFKVIETPHENVGERVVFERGMSPRMGRVDPHYHLDCDQDYEFLEGELDDGDRRKPTRLWPRREGLGSERDLPTTTPSTRLTKPIKFRTAITPSPALITAYGDTLAHSFATGSVNRREELPLLQILALTHATDGNSFRAGIPRTIQRVMLPAANALARLRGQGVPRSG